jgi:hypothetical protein
MEINDNSASWSDKQRKNTRRLAAWTFAWLLSTALLAFGAKYLWDFNAAYSIAALLTNLVLGGAIIRANIIYLRDLDEMQRKIIFDAMGITLGVGWILGLAYEQMEDVKLISYEPEISHLIIVMCITFMISMIVGHRKYQ